MAFKFIRKVFPLSMSAEINKFLTSPLDMKYENNPALYTHLRVLGECLMNVNPSLEEFHASKAEKSWSRRSLPSLRKFPFVDFAENLLSTRGVARKVCLLEFTSNSNWIISRRGCDERFYIKVNLCFRMKLSRVLQTLTKHQTRIFIFGNVMNQLKQLNADWYAANLALMSFITPDVCEQKYPQ